MCGRFALHSPPRYLASVFAARPSGDLEREWQPSWNIAPTRTVLGVLERDEGRVLEPFRWGLVPSFARELSVGNRAFNARAETVTERPAFRTSFDKRRLVVPADGFYEWSRAPGERRQPYYFSRPDGAPLALAGLWAPWRDPATREWLLSCTILTCAAGADLRDVHDRQPVVLELDRLEAWLDPGCADREQLVSLLAPSHAGTLVRRRVGAAVGKSTTDGPELIAAL